MTIFDQFNIPRPIELAIENSHVLDKNQICLFHNQVTQRYISSPDGGH